MPIPLTHTTRFTISTGKRTSKEDKPLTVHKINDLKLYGKEDREIESLVYTDTQYGLVVKISECNSGLRSVCNNKNTARHSKEYGRISATKCSSHSGCQGRWLQVTGGKSNQTRMWANAQRDGRPAKYRWRPLFNAAKFG